MDEYKFNWCITYIKNNKNLLRISNRDIKKLLICYGYDIKKLEDKVKLYNSEKKKLLYKMSYAGCMYNIINKNISSDRVNNKLYSAGSSYNMDLSKIINVFNGSFNDIKIIEEEAGLNFQYLIEKIINYINDNNNFYHPDYYEDYIYEYVEYIKDLIDLYYKFYKDKQKDIVMNQYNGNLMKYHTDKIDFRYYILKKYYILMVRVYNNYFNNNDLYEDYYIDNYKDIYKEIFNIELYFKNINLYFRNPVYYDNYIEFDEIIRGLILNRIYIEIDSIKNKNIKIEDPKIDLKSAILEHYNNSSDKTDIIFAIYASLGIKFKPPGSLDILNKISQEIIQKYNLLYYSLKFEVYPLDKRIDILELNNKTLNKSIKKIINTFFCITQIP